MSLLYYYISCQRVISIGLYRMFIWYKAIYNNVRLWYRCYISTINVIYTRDLRRFPGLHHNTLHCICHVTSIFFSGVYRFLYRFQCTVRLIFLIEGFKKMPYIMPCDIFLIDPLFYEWHQIQFLKRNWYSTK